ncbi:hypothetical protein SAMN05421666_1478 [Roseovarius nanhaiticus]|uniref:Uncharacterized protein n=2 Tax=Roseovarius nanhaiticus TaxID=573024 RepID=A0A1N7FY18_9RHOB|nr:hypothetical protein SAMN05216208_0658 [Roseovarius nanhaiticus]SIS05211.1 hypothetical protein SAMN05421666_1478 [Roseovarius nanhaiticus]
MDVTQLLALFVSDPVVTIHTGMRFFHFIGLALGLGGAILLDLMMLRFFLRGRIIKETYGIVDFASKVVSMGLLLLWISGIGFLVFYALTKPELLTNPKVHAKLVIVAILTVNGYFIHSVILPGVKSQIGTSLFAGISAVKRSIFLISGAISAVSWIFPVALGAFPQLNFAVPALVILSAYLLLICAAALSMHALILMTAPKTLKEIGESGPDDVLLLGGFPCAGTPEAPQAMPIYAGARRRRLLIEGQG